MWYMWKSYCGTSNAIIDLLWNSLFFISGIVFYLVKTSWRLWFKRYVCLGKNPFQVEKEVYSEPYQTSKMECFASIDFFHKRLRFIYLTVFWIRLWSYFITFQYFATIFLLWSQRICTFIKKEYTSVGSDQFLKFSIIF